MRFLTMLPVLVVTFLASTVRLHAQTPVYGYQVINQYPHDTGAFTQGLELHEGRLYESTGRYGYSSLREVDLTSGAVIRKVDVAAQYFAEGMTVFGGKIFQLTWQSQVAFVYDPATFAQTGQFSYTGEGWGLTHDDQHLIMSDGTNQIRFRDPATFQVVRSIGVFDQGSPVTRINELEYINGQIYANIWQTNLIARIDPGSGVVFGWIDLTGLLPPGTSADVLNGIAYQPATGHLLVTGKWWPYLFEISLVGNAAPVAEGQTVNTAEDTSRAITLTARDTDGDPLTFSLVSGPARGTLTGTPPNVVFTPSANVNGSDSFTFRASDGHAATTAAVSINVSPVNDAPAAGNDAYTTQSNTALVVAAPGVLSNDGDVDGDPVSAIVVGAPTHGSLTLASDGSFTYTPAANYVGPDSFSYRARDASATSNLATVSLTVTTGSVPVASVSPASLSFGNQAVGTTSAVRTVTLSNSGAGPLSIGNIAIAGVNASDFAQTHTCTSPLAQGATCSIRVTFTPTATGQRRASVVITDNAAGSPRSVALSGAGKKSPR